MSGRSRDKPEARWYRGPKRALADLRGCSQDTFVAFERALAPGAPLAALETLVEVVLGESSGA